MSKAFVFPGQGSQAVGMGKALAETFPQARAVLAEVDDALGQKLSLLMFEGPQDELTLTANAQPALLAASLAAIRVLESEAGLDLARDASFVAGHSLGEYSALAAAGSNSTVARPIVTVSICTPGTRASAPRTAFRQWPQLIPSMVIVRRSMGLLGVRVMNGS